MKAVASVDDIAHKSWAGKREFVHREKIIYEKARQLLYVGCNVSDDNNS